MNCEGISPVSKELLWGLECFSGMFGIGALFDYLFPRNGLDPSLIKNLQTVFVLFQTLPGKNCPVV